MSATERLRELLDEYGVKYETEDRPTIRYTEWGDWVFSEPLDAKPHTLGAQCELMCIPATPEQAIAATLGPGTCHLVPYNENYATCSECGISLPRFHGGWWFYCPGCGRHLMGEEVVDE